VIPTTLIDIFALAYPSRRFESAWMGIIVHSIQSVLVIIIVLTFVL
jgi:CAAX protease family protein